MCVCVCIIITWLPCVFPPVCVLSHTHTHTHTGAGHRPSRSLPLVVAGRAGPGAPSLSPPIQPFLLPIIIITTQHIIQWPCSCRVPPPCTSCLLFYLLLLFFFLFFSVFFFFFFFFFFNCCPYCCLPTPPPLLRTWLPFFFFFFFKKIIITFPLILFLPPPRHLHYPSRGIFNFPFLTNPAPVVSFGILTPPFSFPYFILFIIFFFFFFFLFFYPFFLPRGPSPRAGARVLSFGPGVFTTYI